MRDRLINNRNGLTYAANIFMLAFSLVLFILITNPVTQFRILATVCVGLGACTTIFYVITIREPTLEKIAKEQERKYQFAMGNTQTLE